MEDSFITLSRKILTWEWYHDHKMLKLFIHCLLKANWEDKKWMGITVKRSTFITSLQKLSDQTGLTVKEVRGALDRLESTGEISLNKPEDEKKGKPYTLVTICKYDLYQTSNLIKGIERAQEGQGEGTEKAQKGQLLTINNNNNNDNNNIILRGFSENFEIAISNEKYVEAITSHLKISKDRLIQLYYEFHEHLKRTQDTVKSQHMYVSHFRNWYLKKYKIDLKTGTPRLQHKNSI